MNVYVLVRDMSSHNEDLEPIGVFNNFDEAQSAAQDLEATPIKWQNRSVGVVGGWELDNPDPRYIVYEVPMGSTKAINK